MKVIGILLVVVTAGIAAVLSSMSDARVDRRFVIRSLIALAAYLAFAGLGVTVARWAIADWDSSSKGLALLAFLVAWCGLGLSMLVQYAPRLTPPVSERARHIHYVIRLILGLIAVVACIELFAERTLRSRAPALAAPVPSIYSSARFAIDLSHPRSPIWTVAFGCSCAGSGPTGRRSS